jgi:hypothetical protein
MHKSIPTETPVQFHIKASKPFKAWLRSELEHVLTLPYASVAKMNDDYFYCRIQTKYWCIEFTDYGVRLTSNQGSITIRNGLVILPEHGTIRITGTFEDGPKPRPLEGKDFEQGDQFGS